MIEFRNLSHGFGDKTLYKDVNITINKGEKIGLVGANGTGKSTLISILNGTQICDKGDVVVQGKFSTGYLDQYASVDGEKTIFEYLSEAFKELFDLEKRANALIAEGQEKDDIKLIEKASAIFETLVERDFYAIESQIKGYAAGLGISALGFDAQMKTLSGGQTAKVVLCKLLLQNPDFLILDEPTNHLDEAHIAWLEKYLQDFEGTFLIVSHNTQFLDAVCTTIFSVEFCKIVRYKGNYSQFLRQYNEKMQLQDKAIVAQQKEIERLTDYINRNRCRTNTAKQAQSRQKKLDKIEIIEKGNEAPLPHFKFPYKKINAACVVDVSHLSIGYYYPLLKDINLKILNGEKWAIVGFNGLGKTTLLKTIMGQLPPLGGSVELAQNVKIAYFEQTISWDDPQLTALQIMRNEFPKLEDKVLRAYLSKAGLTSKHLQQSISCLSGGEQSKVKLCRLMIEPSNLLILDEPTNHLDPKSKEVLAQAIKDYEGTVVFVSHENDFAESITDKIYRPKF